MGEKHLQSRLLLVLKKIGLVPKISSFKISKLMRFIENGQFMGIETVCLSKKTKELSYIF